MTVVANSNSSKEIALSKLQIEVTFKAEMYSKLNSLMQFASKLD
jgi:hypothetical protein